MYREYLIDKLQTGNLQGERNGLFSFKVLEVEVPGHLPEAKSDTSLLSVWLEIIEPQQAGAPMPVKLHNHENPIRLQSPRRFTATRGTRLWYWPKVIGVMIQTTR